MLNWAIFPHVIPHASIAPTILLNRNDRLAVSDDIWQGAAPARMFTYKVAVEDFNGDGKDDAVTGAFGILQRTATGFVNVWERIPLILSTPDGLIDASHRIRGQETGVLPTFTFAHDMASGDVNGDGFPDFYCQSVRWATSARRRRYPRQSVSASRLTFVCLPSTHAEKVLRRRRSFSDRECDRTEDNFGTIRAGSRPHDTCRKAEAIDA